MDVKVTKKESAVVAVTEWIIKGGLRKALLAVLNGSSMTSISMDK